MELTLKLTISLISIFHRTGRRVREFSVRERSGGGKTGPSRPPPVPLQGNWSRNLIPIHLKDIYANPVTAHKLHVRSLSLYLHVTLIIFVVVLVCCPPRCHPNAEESGSQNRRRSAVAIPKGGRNLAQAGRVAFRFGGTSIADTRAGSLGSLVSGHRNRPAFAHPLPLGGVGA